MSREQSFGPGARVQTMYGVGSIAPSTHGTVGRTPAILLVDDEPDILLILRRLMRDLTAGYDVVMVNGAEQALNQIALRPVRLLITDYSMPKTTGIDLTKAVKQASPTTRVVLITAYATPELANRAHDAGVDYYLSKPFKIDQLMRIARDTLL